MVAVLGIVGGGIAVLVNSGGGSGGDYKLTTPATVLGGTYSKDDSKSLPATQSGSDEYISGGKSVTSVYKSDDAQLSFGGAYGSIDDPEATADKMLSSALSDTSATKQTPSGLDSGITLKCGEKDYGVFKSPFCVWADSSTTGLLMYTPSTEAAASGKIPDSPSVSDFADTTAKFLGEVRVAN